MIIVKVLAVFIGGVIVGGALLCIVINLTFKRIFG